jgi:hypothetical protein
MGRSEPAPDRHNPARPESDGNDYCVCHGALNADQVTSYTQSIDNAGWRPLVVPTVFVSRRAFATATFDGERRDGVFAVCGCAKCAWLQSWAC